LFPLFATAYSDTLPVVAWSSHRSKVLDALPSTLKKSSNSVAIIPAIVSSNEICDHDAVILVDQPGLHASDLWSLRPSCPLVKRLNEASSSFQLAYTRSSAVPFHDLAQSISTHCNSHIISATPGHGLSSINPNSKHVICLTMDSLLDTSKPRQAHMSEQESRLAGELDIITSVFPKHLVIYSASRSSGSVRRQLSNETHTDAFDSPFAPPSNTTLPEGGILKRYQLLTPALIMTLLVVFFILIPIVLVGFNALSSIQSPIRTEPPKSFSAKDKKNQ